MQNNTTKSMHCDHVLDKNHNYCFKCGMKVISKSFIPIKDLVSDCCGSTLETDWSLGKSPFRCGHCGKPCQIMQLKDVIISKL